MLCCREGDMFGALIDGGSNLSELRLRFYRFSRVVLQIPGRLRLGDGLRDALDPRYK